MKPSIPRIVTSDFDNGSGIVENASMTATTAVESSKIEKGISVEEAGIYQTSERTKLSSISIVAACTVGMITTIATLTTVGIAMPTIGNHFHESQDNLQWIQSAFALTNGCFLIPLGRLADIHGRKLFFVLGCCWICIFSLGCGFAQSWVVLAVLRALQGIGPAMVIPASLGILAHAFPPSPARSTAFATFSAGAPLGGALGLTIGGTLTHLTGPSWRSPFYFIAGLSAFVALVSLYVIDNDAPSPPGADKRLDWIGAALITTGLALLLFVLGQSPLAPRGWKTPYILALLFVAVIFIFLFIYWEHFLSSPHSSPRLPPPLMPLKIWTRGHGRFALLQTIAFLEWAGFQSFTFWATLYYQDYIHLNPVLTMIRFLPMTVTGVSCNIIIALLIGRVSAHWLLSLGCFMTSIAGALFANIDTSAPYWNFGLPSMIVVVFGADFVFATGALYVAKLAGKGEQSLAGALFQTLMQLGAAFGLAISTIVRNAAAQRELDKVGTGFDGARRVELSGYRGAQWVCFAFPVFAGLVALVFFRGAGIVGHQREVENEKRTSIEKDVEEGEEK